MLVEPFIPFLLFVLALYATPGPATLSMAASGAAFGFRKTIPYVFGVVFGIIIIFLMVALGLGLLFETYPTIHQLFKWLGFLYMLYLAYKIATSSSVKSVDSSRLGFLQGIPLALLNPKAYFAVIATVAQFTQQGEAYYESFILLIVWVFVLASIIDLAWAYLGVIIGSKLATTGLSSKVNFLFAILLILSVLLTMFV